MKYSFILACLFLFTFQLQSQHLAAFNDHLNHFWVFEAGQFEKLEHLEIQEYQIGGILIATASGLDLSLSYLAFTGPVMSVSITPGLIS